jgi:hypothetical protein
MGQIFKACSEGDLADRPEAHRRTSRWQRDERFFVAKNFSQSVS